MNKPCSQLALVPVLSSSQPNRKSRWFMYRKWALAITLCFKSLFELRHWHKIFLVKVAQSYPTLCDLIHGPYSPWNSPGQNTEVGKPFPSPGNLPNPGIKLRSPALQAGSLPAEPQGKPMNSGVDNLFLLQRIFPTQELNQGLLHCRRILYQLSYQRSPDSLNWA